MTVTSALWPSAATAPVASGACTEATPGTALGRSHGRGDRRVETRIAVRRARGGNDDCLGIDVLRTVVAHRRSDVRGRVGFGGDEVGLVLSECVAEAARGA